MTTTNTPNGFRLLSGGLAMGILSMWIGIASAQQYAPAPGTGPADDGAVEAPQGPKGAAGVRLDPFVIYPSVSLGEGYNDNVALTQNNHIHSAVTVLSPALLAELKGARTDFRLGYVGTYGRYANSSTDNFDYHEFRGGADFDFSARSNLRMIADYLIKSDPRGYTLASTAATTPNKYHQADFGGIYAYGAAGAQGRIEVQTLLTDKRYVNNRSVTTALDYDSQLYGGTFFWRIGPKTEWLIQDQYIKTDYRDPTSVQDNDENRVLTGLKWEATALTTGTAKIGYSEKKYSSGLAAQQRARGGIWEVGVRWSPLTYSIVDFATGKRFNDSQAGPGSTYATTEYATLAWTHGWSERTRSILSGAFE
ncbi:MAG TPA: outer membrane beta-barrel protein, partial [Burkholderiales bacterium]